MSAAPTPERPDALSDDPELRAVIAAKARDAREAADSTVLLGELRSRREAVGGSATLPASDPLLDSRILDEARRRSTQLSSAGSTTRRTQAEGQGIPWWVWLAWIAALAATIAAWRYLE